MSPDDIYSRMLCREADLRVMLADDLDQYEGITLMDAVGELIDAVSDLDFHLNRGGDLPRSWAAER